MSQLLRHNLTFPTINGNNIYIFLSKDFFCQMINQSVTRSAEYCNILKNCCDSSRQSLDCLKPQRTRRAQRRKKEIFFFLLLIGRIFVIHFSFLFFSRSIFFGFFFTGCILRHVYRLLPIITSHFQ